MRYSIATQMKAVKTSALVELKSVKPQPPPPPPPMESSSNDQLVRKMCHQIIKNNEETWEESSSCPKHPTSALRNKMERRRKLIHQRMESSRGRSQSPSPRGRTPPSPKSLATKTSASDETMSSRVFVKRFNPVASIDTQHSAPVSTDQSESSVPDFLKYKSSYSLSSYRKDTEKQTIVPTHVANPSRPRSPFHYSPFSFDTQSSSTKEDARDDRPTHRRSSSLNVSQSPRCPLSFDSISVESSANRVVAKSMSQTSGRVKSSPIPRSLCFSPAPVAIEKETKRVENQQHWMVKQPLFVERANKSVTEPVNKSTTKSIAKSSSKTASSSAGDLKAPFKTPTVSAFAAVQRQAGPIQSKSCLLPIRRTASDCENRPDRISVGIPASEVKSQSRKAAIARVLRDSPRNRSNTKVGLRTKPSSEIKGQQQSTNGATKAKALPQRATVGRVLHTSPKASSKQMGLPSPKKADMKDVTTRPVHLSPGMVLRGSSSSDCEALSTRNNVDIGSLRLKFTTAFSEEIELYRTNQIFFPRPSLDVSTTRGLSVYVRKRPLLADEVETGDFDVIQVLKDKVATGPKSSKRSAVTIFRTNVTSDAQAKLIQPIAFGNFAGVFDDWIDSDHVYRTAVKPLLRTVIKHHKPATLILLGQAGSGKKYTMAECQKRIATEFFSSGNTRRIVHELQCLELVGKKCFDLLNTDDRAAVTISDTEDGGIELQGAQTVKVNSSRELLSNLTQCEDRRTAIRSHTIYQIRVFRGTAKLGVLTLVNCAAIERKGDSTSLRRELQVESAEVNSSFFSLKECIRVRALSSNGSPHRIPYRSSNLTRVLRECLENSDSEISILGHVSPKATDTEHTIQTMKMLSNFLGHSWQEGDSRKLNPRKTVEKPQLSPRDWEHQDLVVWLLKKDLVGQTPVPETLDGRALMKMSRVQLQGALYSEDCDGDAKSSRLFRGLRHESERVMRSDIRQKLTHGRSLTKY